MNREFLQIVSWVGLILSVVVSFFVSMEGMLLPIIGFGYALLYAYGKVHGRMFLLVGSMILTIFYIFSMTSLFGLLDIVLWATIFYLTYKL